MESERGKGGYLKILPVECSPTPASFQLTINQLTIFQQVCVLESLPWEMLCEKRILCQ